MFHDGLYNTEKERATCEMCLSVSLCMTRGGSLQTDAVAPSDASYNQSYLLTY